MPIWYTNEHEKKTPTSIQQTSLFLLFKKKMCDLIFTLNDFEKNNLFFRDNYFCRESWARELCAYYLNVTPINLYS